MSQTETGHIENGHLSIPSAVRLISIHAHQTNIGHHEEHSNRFGEVELWIKNSLIKIQLNEEKRVTSSITCMNA